MQDRVDKAREAYRKRDLTQSQLVHKRHVIHSQLHHEEGHTSNFSLPQIILGGQDGLVNVLGVILGVAAASSNSSFIIVAGLAATFAESFSMAAVAYTSTLAEADYYKAEYEREKWEIEHVPQGEKEEIRALYENYGFKGKILDEIVERITSNNKNWLKVMMEQELKLEYVDRSKALPQAFVVGISALVGSFIPLIPYFFLPVMVATVVSLICTALVLFAAGFYKAKVTLGRSYIKMGAEMMVIGLLSALVGYIVGSLFKV